MSHRIWLQMERERGITLRGVARRAAYAAGAGAARSRRSWSAGMCELRTAVCGRGASHLAAMTRGSLYSSALLLASSVVFAAVTAHGQEAEAPTLVPGSGFSGDTPQPDPVGTGFGADAKAIARWDVVPFQTFDCAFEIGVVAFHINGIDRVEFSLNGGPWAAVTEMTRNPRTNVVEYWANLDCEGLADGPVEIRAIAYPTVGIPRVLGGAMNGPGAGKGEHSLFLNSNGNGTLPVISRYVAPTGDDTTGDGSIGKPFKTIMKAARAIQNATGKGNADGGRILLAPGDHRLGKYAFSLLTKTENTWLTLAPADGTSRQTVRIIGADTDGLRTKLVRLRNLTIAPAPGYDQTILTSNGPMEDYIWVDDCELIGPGRTVDDSWQSGMSGSFFTGGSISQCRDGTGGRLVRDMRIGNIGSDAFSGAGLAVNSVLDGIDSSGTAFHADILQYYGSEVTENRIAYGIEARTKDGQGFFAGDNIALKDIAFVNCNVNNQVEPQVMRVFQFGGPVEHMYVKNCTFRGGARWRTDMNFTAKNVVVENSVFLGNTMNLPIPAAVDGVTYIPAPGS